MGTDIKRYIKIHKYPNRTYLFTNTNGKRLDSSSILSTIKSETIKRDIDDFNATSLSMNGVVNLLEKGVTVAEIQELTFYKVNKIAEIAYGILEEKDISKSINEKLNSTE